MSEAKHLVWRECDWCNKEGHVSKPYAIECCLIDSEWVCHICYEDTHNCIAEHEKEASK
jgi:hypothetical protein